ncbi:redoxin domain-containing protein [Paenibacillus pseudetheri]|uniref:Thiol-disulfide oxidoreductase ResA n=1 Tax=Paenibacillus pseudetheri TaxID=2897682 RepID=A0ABN8FLF1_9BACL|nr:redoxin domain-containing protein [Paenibacillus pseudetheri]CAH1057292.1 Thiol-disulfide oxidoreductase ResA [Paenibacillus pseudetheri]
MSMRRIIAMLVIIAAVTTVVWVFSHNETRDSSERITVGSIAPEFEATTIEGKKVRLSDFQGQIVVLNFWASWCTSCVREMPLLNDIHKSTSSQIETLFINVGESKGTASEYLKDHSFSFPVVIDVTGKISALFGVSALPATYIINGEGKIKEAILGEITDFPLMQLINSYTYSGIQPG